MSAPWFYVWPLDAEPSIRAGGKLVGHPPCKPFGGNCLGSGCVHWMPLPSAEGWQEATCDRQRGYEPVHRAEAERKARKYLLWAATAPDPINERASLTRALSWAKAALTAPVRPAALQAEQEAK